MYVTEYILGDKIWEVLDQDVGFYVLIDWTKFHRLSRTHEKKTELPDGILEDKHHCSLLPLS